MRVEITPREKEVLDLLIQGLDSGEIGLILGIGKGTVCCHRENLRHAFDCCNMVSVAYQYGSGESKVVVVSNQGKWKRSN